MAEYNDDFEPDAATNDDFEPEPPAEPPTMGTGEAFGRGALQGATYDFADELGAGLQAGLAAVTPGMSIKDTYREALRDNRADLAKASHDAPAATGIGRVAGTLASPINKALAPLGLVAGGATAGGLSAFGRSESEGPQQALEIATGAGLGAGGGALASKFPALFPTVAGAGSMVAGALSDDPETQAELMGGGALMGSLGATALLGKLASKPADVARAKIAERLTKRVNAAEAKALRDRARFLQGAVEPVGSRAAGPGPGTGPGAPTPADLEAAARGKLGNEVQENFRYLRSKDPLGLKLGPEAEAGVQAILPDYEAQANERLGQFAQGKEARLKQIMEALGAETEAPTASQSVGPGPAPFLGLHREGYDPKLFESLSTLKPDPLAGFNPKPLGPNAPQVDAELARLRSLQGPGSRLAGAAARSVTNPLIGGGAWMLGRPDAALAAGGLGAAGALVRDPVLATSYLEPLGRFLQSGTPAAARAAQFLAGAEGPALVKKLEFLMAADSEIKAAVEGSNNGP